MKDRHYGKIGKRHRDGGKIAGGFHGGQSRQRKEHIYADITQIAVVYRCGNAEKRGDRGGNSQRINVSRQ